MPRGAHFKKPNPRIIQVSFKVNAAEHQKLRQLASAEDTSIPDWLREQINKADAVEGVELSVEFKEEEQPAKVEKPVKEKVRPVKEEVKIAPNQMSLF